MVEVSTTGFWYSEPFSDVYGAECCRAKLRNAISG
jgi:hypothetical protein